jgi:hypothetical protein
MTLTTSTTTKCEVSLKRGKESTFKKWCFTKDSENVFYIAYSTYELTLKIIFLVLSWGHCLDQSISNMPVLEWVIILWFDFSAYLFVVE